MTTKLKDGTGGSASSKIAKKERDVTEAHMIMPTVSFVVVLSTHVPPSSQVERAVDKGYQNRQDLAARLGDTVGTPQSEQVSREAQNTVGRSQRNEPRLFPAPSRSSRRTRSPMTVSLRSFKGAVAPAAL